MSWSLIRRVYGWDCRVFPGCWECWNRFEVKLHLQKVFFQFRRDGYRTLDVSGLTNRGGYFLDIADYHGGSQKGGIWIPEGKRGEGWVRFDGEIHRFFLGKGRSPVDGPKSIGDEWRRFQVGMGNSKIAVTNHSRDMCGISQSEPDLPPFHISTASQRILMHTNAIRPTWVTRFVWKPNPKSIRISLGADGKRRAN